MLVLVLAAWACAVAATLAGIGGAVLLVPLLVVVGGLDPVEAAPLGLIAVLGASLAAGPCHIHAGLVNHRIGVVVELAAATGAAVGAFLVASTSPRTSAVVLGVVAGAAGLAGLRRESGETAVPQAVFAGETAGEWPASLAGVHVTPSGAVAYEARRAGWTALAMVVAGLVAGSSGTSGGFIKTPLLVGVARLPLRVAAATTTFTLGITAAVALLVFAGHGSLDVRMGAAVIVGSIPGGWTGARFQDRSSADGLRLLLSGLLIATGCVLVATG